MTEEPPRQSFDTLTPVSPNGRLGTTASVPRFGMTPAFVFWAAPHDDTRTAPAPETSVMNSRLPISLSMSQESLVLECSRVFHRIVGVLDKLLDRHGTFDVVRRRGGRRLHRLAR